MFVLERIIVDPTAPEKDWLFCHFNTNEGLASGYVRVRYLNPCTEEETSVLVSAIRASGSAASYSGHPLMLLDCVMIPEETSESTPEPTPEPATEMTPEPSIEPSAEPSIEPSAEITPEQTPVASPEPSVEPTVEPTPEVSPEPSVEPTAEMTPEPSVEPTAEMTPEPSVEPSAEITPEPTPEVSPEPSLEPTVEPTPSIIILDTFLPLENEGQLVVNSDARETDVEFPPELIGLSGELQYTIAVTWLRDDAEIRAWENGNSYVYRPVLPEGYTLAEGVALPTLTVRVKMPDSVSISIDPLFAAPGETVTLSATVTGYEGASFQWQWAAIPKVKVDELIAAEAVGQSDPEKLAEESTVGGAEAASLKWHDEPGATGMVYQFTASPENLNRYWRLVLTLPEVMDEQNEEGAHASLFVVLASLLFPSANAEGGTVIVSDGFASMMSTLGTGDPVLVESITLNVNEMTITQAYTLSATVLPADATDATLTWSSSNPDVATVDNGIVTPGISDGTCTITAITNDGSDVEAECVITVKRYTYSVASGNATITGYTGNQKTSLVIPSVLDGYPVMVIGGNAFLDRSDLTGSLTIPNSITSIEYNSFWGCSGFTESLTIPDSVTSIGGAAFSHCSGFTGSLTIPDSVMSIDSQAFFGCSGFTGGLTIGINLASIGEGAFWGCNGFTESLIIPDSVTSIGIYAFSGCSGFTGSLTIGNSVTSIGEYAFSGCSGFTGSLTIGNSVTSIEDYTFRDCSGFTGSLTIGNSVTSIGNYAFYDRSGFTGSLTIGDSVTSIGEGAFQGCSGFTGSLVIPDNVTSIGDGAFWGCSGFTGSLTIPDSVTSIGGGAFSGCSGFTGSLTIPDSVMSIDSQAFFGCSGFTGGLTIGINLASIGDGAFWGCSGFTGSLTIPDSVTSIGGGAFSGCSGFSESLVIPDSVKSIEDYTFSDCSGFTGSLTIPDDVTSIGKYAFYGCSGFTDSLTIGNRVTSIGEGAFWGCSGFTGSLTIPDSVMSIDSQAFFGCSGFTGGLTIGNSVTSIGDYAFSGCTSLQDVYILAKSYSIGSSPFNNGSSTLVFYGYAGTPLQAYAATIGRPFFLYDENGNLLGNPIQFSEEAIEKTVYLNGSSYRAIIGWARLTQDVTSLGMPVWNLSSITGTSVKNLRIFSSDGRGCVIEYGSILSSGDTSCELTCTVGEFSASMPITIHVSDESVPMSMAKYPSLSGTIGEVIVVPRPVLLPEGTDLDAANFDFQLNCYPAEKTGDSAEGYQVIFRQPGYFYTSIFMRCENISFSQDILFAVADETGNVPGNPIEFNETSVDKVLYLNGNIESNGFEVGLRNNISALGIPEWSLSSVSGDSVSNLRVVRPGPYSCLVNFDELLRAGTTGCILNCKVGAYTASIPVSIRVIDGIVPTSMQFAQTYFELVVGETIIIPRPLLLPLDHVLNEEVISFHTWGITETPEGIWQARFDEPGLHYASVSMRIENIEVNQYLVHRS